MAQEELRGIFTQRRNGHEAEELKAALYRQIGQLNVELDWVKKKLDWPAERKLIEAGHPQLSLCVRLSSPLLAQGYRMGIFISVRVFPRSSVQMLTDGLLDHVAGDSGEVVIFA